MLHLKLNYLRINTQNFTDKKKSPRCQYKLKSELHLSEAVVLKINL